MICRDIGYPQGYEVLAIYIFNVETLIDLLITVYVKLYADTSYINTFDDNVIFNIIKIYGS